MSRMTLSIARSELILGGQKSGKSRRAELLARDWLDQSTDHCAVFLATAQPPKEPAEADFEAENGPKYGSNQPLALCFRAQAALFLGAIEDAPGPVVLVGNEIGLGVIPLGREVRAFVDALGLLNQQVAQTCQRVTLMAAGLPLSLKDS